MNKLLLLCAMPFFLFAQETLQDYVDDTQRQAPTPLYEAPQISAAQAELEEALSALSSGNRAKMEAYLAKYDNDYKAALAEYNRLMSSMAMTEKGKSALPYFWYNGNQITCRNISIVDAAQSFSPNTFYIDFQVSDRQSVIKRDFTNKDIREAFALYDTNNQEVPFYNPKDLNKDMRYTAGDVYRVAYSSRGALNNIRCAKRKFDFDVMYQNGKYGPAETEDN